MSLSLSHSTWFHPPKAASRSFENLAEISNYCGGPGFHLKGIISMKIFFFLVDRLCHLP